MTSGPGFFTSLPFGSLPGPFPSSVADASGPSRASGPVAGSTSVPDASLSPGSALALPRPSVPLGSPASPASLSLAGPFVAADPSASTQRLDKQVNPSKHVPLPKQAQRSDPVSHASFSFGAAHAPVTASRTRAAELRNQQRFMVGEASTAAGAMAQASGRCDETSCCGAQRRCQLFRDVSAGATLKQIHDLSPGAPNTSLPTPRPRGGRGYFKPCNCFSIVVASLTSKLRGFSMFRSLTTPSSMNSEQRCMRMPIPGMLTSSPSA